ncbi:MAG: flagellar hook-basal body complex protein [Rhodospirillaceae bacterium]|nr:flagellar hook-basal body complex protein [Rhodospirillaceae bacterium]
MSLFGALFSGVSGLQSQSSAMGAIADNVTNVNTTGYKATLVNFKTLVTAQVSLTQYSPGGVQSAPRQGVDIQGLLQATTASTDIGISGSGFFVTNAAAEPQQGDLFTYTRAGSFSVDKAGFLQNSSGAYMQGWPLSSYAGAVGASTVTLDGNVFQKSYIDNQGSTVLINDNVIDSRNMRPINLQTIGGTASPTTTMNIGANLPAGAQIGDQQDINAQIFDSLGNSHNITYTGTNIGANKWNMSVIPPAGAASITQKTQKGEVYFSAGRIDLNDTVTAPIQGQIDFTVNSASFSIIFSPTAGSDDGVSTIDTTSRTVSQILDEAAKLINTQMETAYGTTAPDPPGKWARHLAGENGISFDQASTTDMTFGMNSADPVQDADGKSVLFQNDTAGYTVPGIDGGDEVTDFVHGWYDLTGVIGGTGTPQLGVPAVKFSGVGTPAQFFGYDGAAAPDPKSKLEVVWTNGAANMQSGSQTSPAVLVNFGNYNTPDGLTQLSGSFQLNYIQQNGAKFGNFAGVSINKQGIVSALFDNGVTRPVYMIPLATFTNPNGLSSLSGNVWIATDFSGNPTLRQAGDAGAGEINAASLENSTVDLGTEFTRMITTQRAYSSAAKVITTADDMLSELLNIKR